MMRSRSLRRILIFLAFAFGISLFVIGLFTPSLTSRHDTPGERHLTEEWEGKWKKYDEELRLLKQKQEEILQALDKMKHLQRKAEDNTAHADRPVPVAQDVSLIAVLMIGCNRPSAIERSLSRLIAVRPSAEKFPIIVSLDCAHAPTETVVKNFGNKVKLIKQPDQSPLAMDLAVNKRNAMQGYYKISRHYRWAFGQVFDEMKHDTVIIVEDDLDVADDFFELMQGTEPLLQKDPTLWCISAWNDNGKKDFINPEKADALYRTDFFPGLGWMIKRSLWDELKNKWPASYWDDWMRNPEQRKDRACIRPEVSRTFTFGNVGVSRGQFWKMHLQYIQLNKKKVKFSELDLSYLMKDTYDKKFLAQVYAAPLKSYSDMAAGSSGPARVEYRNNVEFKMIAKQFQIMEDLRAGVPRMAYHGIVPFSYRSQQVYLAPPSSWKAYTV